MLGLLLAISQAGASSELLRALKLPAALGFSFTPNQGSTVKSKQLMTACFIVGTLMIPFAVRAADGDTDRSHPTAFVKDSVITTKVKTKLAADTARTLAHVRVDTDANGMVVLRGTAKNQEEINAAVSIARGTEGVTSVQNHIKIKKGD